LIFAKDHKTLDMFDPLARFGPHRRERLEKSWARLFREEILPELPVHKLRPFFSESKGAPTKDLYAMLGIALLQQMHDLTDEETIDRVAFDLKWHFALNLSEGKAGDVYVCPKTLWTLRHLLSGNDLSGLIFQTATEKLAKLFSVNPSHQRLDSTHIFSNMRHLGRIGLFVRVIRTFLVNLKRHHIELFDALPQEVTEKYLRKSSESVFSMVKPSESGKTLSGLGDDLFFLARRFREEKAVAEMTSYHLLCRCLSEQCVVEDAGSATEKVRVKPNADVASDSLQNPSDPDATYSGHKGQGYQAQIMETYSPSSSAESDTAAGGESAGATNGSGLRLITHLAVEQAHQSDTHALIPAIESAKERGLAPAEVLADSLYGSEKNIEAAKTMGTEVVAPVPGGEGKGKSSALSEFALTDEGGIANCPMGHAPIEDVAVGNHREAVFAVEHCFGCPRKKDCPIRSVRNGYGFSYDRKQVKMARRRAREKTAVFRDRYRYRSGVESTMSELDRKTGVKRLRVRGMTAVRYCVTLKILGLNIFRAAAWSARNVGNPGPQGEKSDRNGAKYPVGAGISGILRTVRLLVCRLLDHPAPFPGWRRIAYSGGC
jgi:hypothetical protein